MSVPNDVLHAGFGKQSWLQQLKPTDWIWAAVLIAAAVVGYTRYGSAMNAFQVGILIGVTGGAIALSTYWKATRWLIAVVAAVSLLAIDLYGTDLAR
ncbi:MAG: c-type cytochrome biogenesis protein CcsB, partial [Gammaproteobacteria bacterium]